MTAESPDEPLRCPILYYHETFGQAAFEAQLVTFLANSYQPITLGKLVSLLETQQPAPPGCLVLTFDDGLASQVTGAVPVLARYLVPATFFVMPAFQDGVHRYMTPQDFTTLRDLGFEVSSHTMNHASLPALRRLNFGAFLAELAVSRRELESLLQQPVRLLAYPYGTWDLGTAAEVERLGYRAAVSTMPGALHRPSERYWLRRIAVNPWEAPGKVVARIGAPAR